MIVLPVYCVSVNKQNNKSGAELGCHFHKIPLNMNFEAAELLYQEVCFVSGDVSISVSVDSAKTKHNNIPEWINVELENQLHREKIFISNTNYLRWIQWRSFKWIEKEFYNIR